MEKCPRCNAKMKKRKKEINGKLTDVLVCSNYPFCDYHAEEKYTVICPVCKKLNCICNKEE